MFTPEVEEGWVEVELLWQTPQLFPEMYNPE